MKINSPERILENVKAHSHDRKQTDKDFLLMRQKHVPYYYSGRKHISRYMSELILRTGELT